MVTFIFNLFVLFLLLVFRIRPCGGGREFYKLACCGKNTPKELNKEEEDKLSDNSSDDESEEFDKKEEDESSDKSSDDEYQAPHEVHDQIEGAGTSEAHIEKYAEESSDDDQLGAEILDDQAYIKNRILGAYKLYLKKMEALEQEE
jgi:hypothetical protein